MLNAKVIMALPVLLTILLLVPLQSYAQVDGDSELQTYNHNHDSAHIDQSPTLTAPPDLQITATGPLTSVDSLGTPRVYDDIDDTMDIVIENDAPERFPLGTTIVNWIATDTSGLVSVAIQNVTLVDRTPPTFNDEPQNITIHTLLHILQRDFVIPTATDVVDPDNVSVSCSPSSGSSFILGTISDVECIATDGSGRTTATTFTISTSLSPDTTAPNIIPPSDKTFEASAISPGPNANTLIPIHKIGFANVIDDQDPSPHVLDITSKSFPLGTTTITWTATDAAGNVNTATQRITIQDTTPPIIIPPTDKIYLATGHSTLLYAHQIGFPTVSDNQDRLQDIHIGDNATHYFELGTTPITWTATDQAGNAATATQYITLIE